MDHLKPAVVIDNGTGYTKMGYAGNFEPSHIIPTAISSDETPGGFVRGKHGISDLDFYIGDEAVSRGATSTVNYPIQHGLIENWNNMERLWQRCMFKYLRCEPEEHYFLLTEPPLNTPENREYTAEVMFETYNVPGLYIAVQAVLALAASWTRKQKKGAPAFEKTFTGTVIDSGDGVTHVIPVADGYVIGSCIKHIPLAGRDITEFVMNFVRDRGEKVPAELAMATARKIKEDYCYVSKSLVKEFKRFDAAPEESFRRYIGRQPRTGGTFECDVGYESFLGPELFFSPEIFNAQFQQPLSEVVDDSILACPVDYRRKLYGNIVLSGGSTLFRNFSMRLQREIRSRVGKRLQDNMDALRAKYPDREITPPSEIEVNVIKHGMQRFAVWFGGSMLAGDPAFQVHCHSRADYLEQGPRIARHNAVFNTTL